MRSNILSTIKNTLAAHKIKPNHGLGQNFLVNESAITKLVATAEVSNKDIIFEIGPGLGQLTRAIARKAKKVVAVEKDSKMVEILKEQVANFQNVEIVHGDALKADYAKYHSTSSEPASYKVVANLPYYITAPIIRKFLELEEAKPQCMVLVVQKEVAQRICAKPPNMNILACSVQFYSTPKIISYIKKSSFWPQPKVDAAILQITPHQKNSKTVSKKFFRVMKAGFSHPRKQLINNFSAGLGITKEKASQELLKHNIQPVWRAETLTIQDWINLAKDV